MPPQSTRVSTLPGAMLLACAGGMLDATVYIGHGQVFVNAMTGNVVLLGIAAVGGHWSQVGRHMDVIGAFLVGVVAAEFLHSRPTHLAARSTLTLEIVIVGVAGLFAAKMPLLLLLAMLAFVSAFQVATFRRVGPFLYNSTFLTGNLREMVAAAIDRKIDPDPARRYRDRQKALDLGLICVAFLAGGAAGAWLEPIFPQRSLLFADLPLFAVMAISVMTGRPKA